MHVGYCYLEKGQHDDAIAYLKRALAQDSEIADAWSFLGSAYLEIGRYSEAIDASRKVIT